MISLRNLYTRIWPLSAPLFMILFSGLVFHSCGKQSENMDTQANAELAKVSDQLAEDSAAKVSGGANTNYTKPGKKEKKDVKTGTGESLEISDYNPGQFAGKKRLIEHFVNLHFEVDSVAGTRSQLLELTKGKGFVESAATGSEGKEFASSGYIRYTAQIRSKDLYQFLQDVGDIGRLQSESIRTTDHTAAFKKEELKAEMLAARIARQNLLGQKTGAKNAVQAEQVLVQSEDSALNAKYEKWRITDRVRWAQVAVYAHLPRTTGWDIPDYSKGFKGLLEGALYLAYALIYLIPIMLLAFAGWQAFRYFRRKFVG